MQFYGAVVYVMEEKIGKKIIKLNFNYKFIWKKCKTLLGNTGVGQAAGVF